jgi:hypothetical protein
VIRNPTKKTPIFHIHEKSHQLVEESPLPKKKGIEFTQEIRIMKKDALSSCTQGNLLVTDPKHALNL